MGYCHANPSPALIDATSGSVVERYDYTPYGQRFVLNANWTNHANPTSGSYNNQIGHHGLFRNNLTGLIDNRNRIYHPTVGRFTQRDPLGYPDGMNTYAGYHIMWGGVDPWGMNAMGLIQMGGGRFRGSPEQILHNMLAEDARQKAIVATRIPKATAGPRSLRDAYRRLCTSRGGRVLGLSVFTSCRGASPIITMQNVFDEWMSMETARGAWWTSLPKCPHSLCLTDGKLINPDPNTWEDPKTPERQEKQLHPGAIWSMRSKAVGDFYNQCIYDDTGMLITTPPGAGTVDAAKSGLEIGHFKVDVLPAILANELDGGGHISMAPSYAPNQWINAEMQTPAGSNVLKYYTVRPSWH